MTTMAKMTTMTSTTAATQATSFRIPPIPTTYRNLPILLFDARSSQSNIHNIDHNDYDEDDTSINPPTTLSLLSISNASRGALRTLLATLGTGITRNTHSLTIGSNSFRITCTCAHHNQGSFPATVRVALTLLAAADATALSTAIVTDSPTTTRLAIVTALCSSLRAATFPSFIQDVSTPRDALLRELIHHITLLITALSRQNDASISRNIICATTSIQIQLLAIESISFAICVPPIDTTTCLTIVLRGAVAPTSAIASCYVRITRVEVDIVLIKDVSHESMPITGPYGGRVTTFSTSENMTPIMIQLTNDKATFKIYGSNLLRSGTHAIAACRVYATNIDSNKDTNDKVEERDVNNDNDYDDQYDDDNNEDNSKATNNKLRTAITDIKEATKRILVDTENSITPRRFPMELLVSSTVAITNDDHDSEKYYNNDNEPSLIPLRVLDDGKIEDAIRHTSSPMRPTVVSESIGSKDNTDRLSPQPKKRTEHILPSPSFKYQLTFENPAPTSFITGLIIPALIPRTTSITKHDTESTSRNGINLHISTTTDVRKNRGRENSISPSAKRDKHPLISSGQSLVTAMGALPDTILLSAFDGDKSTFPEEVLDKSPNDLIDESDQDLNTNGVLGDQGYLPYVPLTSTIRKTNDNVRNINLHAIDHKTADGYTTLENQQGAMLQSPTETVVFDVHSSNINHGSGIVLNSAIFDYGIKINFQIASYNISHDDRIILRILTHRSTNYKDETQCCMDPLEKKCRPLPYNFNSLNYTVCNLSTGKKTNFNAEISNSMTIGHESSVDISFSLESTLMELGNEKLSELGFIVNLPLFQRLDSVDNTIICPEALVRCIIELSRPSNLYKDEELTTTIARMERLVNITFSPNDTFDMNCVLRMDSYPSTNLEDGKCYSEDRNRLNTRVNMVPLKSNPDTFKIVLALDYQDGAYQCQPLLLAVVPLLVYDTWDVENRSKRREHKANIDILRLKDDKLLEKAQLAVKLEIQSKHGPNARAFVVSNETKYKSSFSVSWPFSGRVAHTTNVNDEEGNETQAITVLITDIWERSVIDSLVSLYYEPDFELSDATLSLIESYRKPLHNIICSSFKRLILPMIDMGRTLTEGYTIETFAASIRKVLELNDTELTGVTLGKEHTFLMKMIRTCHSIGNVEMTNTLSRVVASLLLEGRVTDDTVDDVAVQNINHMCNHALKQVRIAKLESIVSRFVWETIAATIAGGTMILDDMPISEPSVLNRASSLGLGAVAADATLRFILVVATLATSSAPLHISLPPTSSSASVLPAHSS